MTYFANNEKEKDVMINEKQERNRKDFKRK